MRKALRRLGLALVVLIAALMAAFGLLQTRAGKHLIAAAVARAAGGPDFSLAIDGLGGLVPFRMTARTITVGDAGGAWLTLRGVRLEVEPAGLIAGELHIRLARAAEIEAVRAPTSPSEPLAERLRVPRLPVALVVDRLVIDRLALAPRMLGPSVVTAVAGDVAISGEAAGADLDIQRIDGSPGNIKLQMRLAGVPPKLSVRLEASEPTGFLLAQALGRTDHLPLAVTLEGTGPLSKWHGRLTASAGPQANLDADIALAVAAKTVLGVSARADVARLMPPDFAPLVGSHALLTVQATFGEQIAVDRLSLATASGTATGDAVFGGPNHGVAAHLRADLPDLSNFGAITGGAPHGSAVVSAELAGSEHRPEVRAELSAAGVGAFGWAAERAEAQISATPTGALGDRQTRIAIEGRGRFAGLVVPEADAWATHFGREIEWSLSASADPDARALDLARLHVRSGGIDLNGSGRLALAKHGIIGAGKFSGSASDIRTGVAAADVLLGPRPAIAGTIGREESGAVFVDDLALTGAAARLSANARFDPASDEVTAALSLDIPRLDQLRTALGADIAGSVSAKIKAQGQFDRLKVQTEVNGSDIAAGGASIERLQLSAGIPDLSRPRARIDGSFRAGGLNAKLALAVAPIGDTGLAIDQLRLSAADSTITGALRIALADGLVQGSLSGRLADLSRWSGLAGTPLRGGLDFTAGFAAPGGGQALDLTVNGIHLAASRIEIGRLTATAQFADLRHSPSATGRLSLGAVRSGALDFTSAAATFDSPRPGRFAFRGSADGHPLTMAFAGEGGLVAGGADLRLARLTGLLSGEQFALEQPLDLSRRGADFVLSQLALRLGSGRITGSGSARGEVLAFTLDATKLPIAAGARLMGYPNLHGDLSTAATLGGTLRAPRGRFTLNAAGLSLAVSQQTAAPRLGLAAEGDWNGRTVDVKGQVTGLHGDRMAFTGSVPLLLTPTPFGIALPSQAPLAVNLQGGGDIGHLADLLPLGEDRLSGRFAADVAIGGTVAAPSASGRLQLADARYENFASGAVLTDLKADVVGNGDRLRLASLSAGDGAGGTLTGQGGLVLSGPTGPAAQLSVTLTNFRLAARDEALATASGTVFVTGALAAPKVTAPLTIGRAEFDLPNSLPPSVVVLHVSEINGRKRPGPRPQTAAAPALPAVLDITLNLPGPVLVRGQGLDSQWRGRLTITGTTAAPKIAGTLVASRGSYTLLGKSFRLTRGTITFDGSAKIDPALDIVAEASAADVTAQVVISGFASAPKVTLNSTPPLPRDEILARVLFGRGVRQITPGEGLELAQAAAAIAGGGPGLLDRLRGGLGLDWLRFGQGPAGAASSILNPSIVTPSTQSATAVSAGKYIAPGVSVGVTQGVSPPTSKVTVEVDIGHHVTVDTEAGQNIGTGIGLNYNYDY